MPLTVRITVAPEGGTFPPTAFSDLLQQRIELPGLDDRWTHTLVDVQVADDGATAELVVHSDADPALGLDTRMRVVTTTPPAYVRAFDADGNELHAGPHPAPLWPGQDVAIGNDHYTVGAIDWPGRHPDTGVCAGAIDWQHVTLHPAPRPAHLPSLADVQ